MPNSNTVIDDASCVPQSHYRDADGAWQESQCHVRCKVGYTGEQKKDEYYTCTADGSWSGSLSCPAVSCPADSWWSEGGSSSNFPGHAGPSSVDAACRTPSSLKTLHDTCTLTCNQGYTANGQGDTYTCVANQRQQEGKWQGTAELVCAPVACDSVYDPDGGTVTVQMQDGTAGDAASPYFSGVADGTTRNGGTKATYTCDDGFVLNPVEGPLTENDPTDKPVDRRVLYCNIHGKWADASGKKRQKAPTCFKMCSDSQPPCAQGSVNPAGRAQGVCNPVSTGDTGNTYKYTCSCAAGWQRTTRSSESAWINQGQTCEDIDECATTNGGSVGGCERSRCVNTQGSFYCDECNNQHSCCAGGQGRTRERGHQSGEATALGGNPAKGQPIDTCCDADKGSCDEGVGGYCDRITPARRAYEDWLPAGPQQCVGPPDASESVLALGELCVDDSDCRTMTSADGGDWAWRPSDCGDASACSTAGATSIREAGAPILITIVAKDSNGAKNAELAGVCRATDFSATVTEHGGSASGFSFGSSDYDGKLGPFYLSQFQATVVGDYTVAVFIRENPMAPSPSFTIQVVAAPGDATTSNIAGTECTETNACNCLKTKKCTILPSDTLKFTVTIRDKYQNIRDKDDGTWTQSDRVVLQTTATDSNSDRVGDMHGQWDSTDTICPDGTSPCWAIKFDTSKSVGKYSVALKWSNDTCDSSTCGSNTISEKFQIEVEKPDP
eukprot:COSAG01_NODE_9799_length_2340_cov_5.227552_1_plen_725_part_01